MSTSLGDNLMMFLPALRVMFWRALITRVSCEAMVLCSDSNNNDILIIFIG